MSTPLVSVIIPVGPSHVRYAPQAVASVAWSSVAPHVEAIVVNDSGRDLTITDSSVCGPVIQTGGARGPAVARNMGIAAARGAFCLFLDADDYLLPGGVEALLRGYVQSDVGYTYGDVYTTIEAPGSAPNIGRTPDYDQADFARHNLHVVTALVPTVAARAVGGFDEAVAGFEDWTLFLRLAIAGVCGRRIPQMTMVYRTGLGERARDHGQTAAHAHRLMSQIVAKYANDKGVIAMASCCGGDDALKGLTIEALAAIPPPSNAIVNHEGDVRMEFYGPERGSVPYRSPVTNRSYQVGNNAINRFAHVHPADVEWLLSVMDIRIVPPVAPFVPAPEVATADAPEASPKALKPTKGRAAPEVLRP